LPPKAFSPPSQRLHDETLDIGGVAPSEEREDTAAFFSIEGNSYLPSPHARGPWAPTVSGPIIGGLLGRTLERDAGNPELHPARLTVDLPQPTLLKPVVVQTSVVREGRRIKLVEAVALQRGQVTARASAVFVRRGEQPDGQVWSTPVAMPAAPDRPDEVSPDLQMLLQGYGVDRKPGIPWVEWEKECAQKFIWVRQIRPLVEGEALSAFTSAAMAADVTSALTHWGTAGLHFLNVDYTMTLSRLPEGPDVGLASMEHYSAAGVASGTATLFDHRGPIGTGVAVALARTSETFKVTNLHLTRC
jgi:hypothetical protein